MDEIKIDRIIRSKRRSIALVVSFDATLVVRAPLRISLEYIKNLISEKRSWIEKRRWQILKNGGPAKSKEFVDGESFLYLGENYELKIARCKSIDLKNQLYFPEKYLKKAREKMIKWYKKEAREIITERAKLYGKISGWNFQSISITSANTRWGSCSPNGSINFPWKLIMAPLYIVDYVVVHELAHIPEKNHSKRFWKKVEIILPDYKTRRKWLKENGNKFVI